ncbi:Ig-like domain-containing protein [Anaerosporobacter faecicola]|uniref:Ig-like domain-containing protein n=1 Tax=Anaerosporobacter faecicola TaxID=2718714 RepID=UPI001439C35A|nr:Ig-like domain-containing protein [Anaerosporobacter faecicola]
MRRKKVVAILQAIVFFITSIATGFKFDVGGYHTVKAEVVKDNTVTINPQLAYQTWQGFGTSLCWWANAVGGFTDIAPTTEGAAKGYTNRYEEIMDLVFGVENGLGLNIVRYNIGGGDDESLDFINRSGAKIPGYMDESGTYNWEADKNQVTVLKDAYEMIKESGQTFYNQMFANSPPYFMTYSGSSTGGSPSTKDQLMWDKYDDFVEYLLNVSNYIQTDQGVPITDIDPINEPNSGYWTYGSQKQEGAQFNADPQPATHVDNYDASTDPYDPTEYSAMNKIYEILGDKLTERQAAGQLEGVQITGTDETSIDVQKQSFGKLTDKAKNYIAKISTHEYSGSDRVGLYNIAASYDKELWQDEVSFGGGTRNATAMDSGAFAVSNAINKDMNDMRATAWVGWQAVESMGENIYWNSNWGFIHAVYEEPTWKTGTTTDWAGNAVDEADTDPLGISQKQYSKSTSGYSTLVTPELYESMGLSRGDYYTTKQYYVLGQYSRYIKEGYQIIDVSDSNYVAALSPDKKKLVFVVTNDTTDDQNYSVQLDNMTNFGTVTAVRTSDTEAWSAVTNPGNVVDGTLEITAKASSVTTYVVNATTGNELKTDDVNGHYVSAAIKYVTLSKDSIDKFDYTGSWTDLTDAAYYQNYACKSETVGDTVTYVFDGRIATIYGSTSSDGGMMAVSVDGAKETFVDTYTTSTKTNATLFTTGLLEEGTHTITIRNAANKNVLSQGNNVIISYALSANGLLAEKDELKITAYSALQGKIGIEFNELTGVDTYAIKYGLKSGEYTFCDTNVEGSPYYLTNLASGATYYVVVTTVKDGTEIVSNEICATPKEENGSVLYYVNCGAPSSSDTGDDAEVFGIYNSVADQAYGKDAVTNMAWGYDTANGTWARETASDKWDSLRCDTSDAAGGTIKYSFEIPNDTYEVSVGIFDPWNNENRKTDLIINEEVKKEAFVVGKTKTTETNNVTVTNGRIDVSLKRSEGVTGGGEDPQISWIKIRKVVVEYIKSVETFATATVRLGEIPVLPTSANVVYEDDSTGTEPITWETVSSDMFTVGFKPVTITGSIPGSSKTVSYVVTPMPSRYVYIMDLASNADGSTNSDFIDRLVADTSSVLLNTVREQKSDGTTWGWLPNGDDSSDLGPNNADGEYTSLRYANDSNRTIDTIFPIDNGTYDVAIGTSNPWGSWSRGNNDFYAEGTKYFTEEVPAANTIHVMNGIEVSDGVLNVSVQASSGNNNGITIYRNACSNTYNICKQ